MIIPVSCRFLPNFHSKKTSNSKMPFSSRVVAVYPYDAKVTQSQKDFIDRFEETSDANKAYELNCKFLGEGVCSKAFYVPSYNFVIKQNKPNPSVPEKGRNEIGSLAHENKILLSIDDHVENTQRGIAYLETEKNGKFLLSTLVDGEQPDYVINPMTPKHVDRLLRTLYRLDKSKVLNTDLSNANILLTSDNRANIIDYQWGEIINPTGSNTLYKTFSIPEFEDPSNITSYEAAGLSGYISRMEPTRAREFMRNYLFMKAHYSEKKAKRLEQIYQDSGSPYLKDRIEFEKAKTHVYQYPNDAVIDAELLKMDILKNHRKQYSYLDVNVVRPRNILAAIEHCVNAKASADKLAYFSPPEANRGDELTKKYFYYMNRYGKHWQNNCKDWYPSTLLYVYRVVTDSEHASPNIYFKDKIYSSEDGNNLRRYMKDVYKNESGFDSESAKIKKDVNKIIELYQKAHEKGYSDYSIYNEIRESIGEYLSL